MRARSLVAAMAVAASGLTTVGILRRARAIAQLPRDLRSPVLVVPLLVSARTLPVLRRLRLAGAPVVGGVSARREVLPARDGQPGVPVWVYEPQGRARPTGALLWIHGGGLVMGDPVTYHGECSSLARDAGVLVVSVNYRLAPGHPFPAGLDDCSTALTWLHDHAADLGVDPSRLAVGGDSAGGGLGAALAQRAHDEGGVPVSFQLLVYPMLDDRTVLRADHGGTGTFVWTPGSNRFGWESYLGHAVRADEPRPYAAPARRTDLSGLPPAWVGVGDLDLFHAEDVDYAARLEAAGVRCELLVVPGMYHGADAVIGDRAECTRGFRAAMARALGEALAPAGPAAQGARDD